MYKKNLETIIQNGKNKEVIGVIRSALENGADPNELITIMTDAIEVVGNRFQAGEILISDMLAAAMTMKKGIGFLTPLIRGDGSEYIGTAIIGMAEGDLHDIGKNLLAIMFESVGFKVIDLGIDVSSEAFSDALLANPECKVLAISATLMSTVSAIENTIALLEKKGQRNNVKIIVGGGSVNAEIAEKIGADAYAPTTTGSALIAKSFLEN